MVELKIKNHFFFVKNEVWQSRGRMEKWEKSDI